MPKRRHKQEIWDDIRVKILDRDGWQCVRCSTPLVVNTAHIDHIQSGKFGTNSLSNLRSLCRRCHVLRLDHRHRGMIAKALADGIIGPKWREELWE